VATTIQVSDGTKQILERIKHQEHVSNYDQVIQMLLKNKTRIPDSMFGTSKKMTWTKKDRMKFDRI